MKIITASESPKPTVVQAIHFSPWPFRELSIQMDISYSLLDTSGSLIPSGSTGWHLDYLSGRIVAGEMSDGTKFVTSLLSLNRYMGVTG